MNERIKELLIEAHKQTKGGIYNGHLSEWSEKFAELIVRECLNQCYNRGMNDELYAGQLKAATYIEEHFGVEN